MLATAAVIAQCGVAPDNGKPRHKCRCRTCQNLPAGFQIAVDQGHGMHHAGPARTRSMRYRSKTVVAAAARTTQDGQIQDDRKHRDLTMACTSPEKMTGTVNNVADDSYTQTMKMVTAQGEMTMKMSGKRIGTARTTTPAAAAVAEVAPLRIFNRLGATPPLPPQHGRSRS